jgi:hypothetical protein
MFCFIQTRPAPHAQAAKRRGPAASIIDLNQTGPPYSTLSKFIVRRPIVRRLMVMISIDDCIALCGLDADEVAAIAEHEHIPDVAAAAFANYLLQQAGGAERIRTMMIDDIHKALDDGRIQHAAELFMALRHFLDQHPAGRVGLTLEAV